jgi:uncharacterized protein YxjI
MNENENIAGIIILVAIIIVVTILGINIFKNSDFQTVEEKINTSTESIVDKSNTENSNNDSNVLEQINNAQNVQVIEKVISLNKEYEVYVDSKVIATVSGKYINVTGDVFKLKDNSGNIVASEKQIKRWGVKLNRLARLMDENENTVGYIGEDVIKDLFSLSKYKFHFYDENKNEYAHTKEKILSLLYEFEVYDESDNEIYKIEEDFNLLTDSYNITKTKDSDVSMEKVIFLTCIVDAIRDSEE